MKYIIIGVFALFLIGVLSYEGVLTFIGSQNIEEPLEDIAVTASNTIEEMLEEVDSGREETVLDIPPVEVIAENLTIPWDIAFLPNGALLITERDGTIVRLDTKTKEVTEIAVERVSHRGEGGLLGMTLHPNFKENNYLYLYLTSTLGAGVNASVNEVVRYQLQDDTLVDRTVIVGDIPGSLFHNGGRIAFGPDGLLYIATGDARDPESAQDLDSLAGKILRVTDTGGIPGGNPPGTMVYAYGSRNAQGLTWDTEGNLWSTEHGRTTATKTGMDEVNLIVKGGNYGWPHSEGDTVLEGTEAPKLHSGPSVTWAPGGALYWDGSLFFPGLRGETLYEAVLSGTEVIDLKEHFKGEYGRLRTIVAGPDGAFYLTTSNRDGRGNAREGDDKIIRLNPQQFRN